MRYETILLRLFHLVVLISRPPSVVHGLTISVFVPEDEETTSSYDPADDDEIVKLIAITRSTVTFELKFGQNMTADKVTSVRLGYRPETEVRSLPTLEWDARASHYVTRGSHLLDDRGTLEYFRSHLQANRITMVIRLRFPATKYRFMFEYYRDNVPVERVALLARTLPSLPVPLKTGPGCFHVCEVRRSERSVKVYWQKVLEEGLRVDISVYEHERSGAQPAALVQEIIGHTARLGYVWLDLSHQVHRIVLTTVNEVGRAPTSSVVWIPSQFDLLPIPEASLQVNETKSFEVVSLFLCKPEDVNIANYTVAIIEATTFLGSPVSVEDLVYLPAVDKITEFHMTSNGTQRLAVSVNAETSSSGIHNMYYGDL